VHLLWRETNCPGEPLNAGERLFSTGHGYKSSSSVLDEATCELDSYGLFQAIVHFEELDVAEPGCGYRFREGF
jgi:hypothetical protein